MSGEAFVVIAIEDGAGQGEDGVGEPVSQGNEMVLRGFSVFACFVEGDGHSDDCGDIFGAWTFSAFLRAAFEDADERDIFSGVEDANAFWAAEFVGREREHIDLLCADIDGNMADGLDGIGVKNDAVMAADMRNFRDRLYGARLVICGHDGDEAGGWTDTLGDLFRAQDAVGGNVEEGDFEAVFFEFFHGIQDGVMFEGGGDDVFF